MLLCSCYCVMMLKNTHCCLSTPYCCFKLFYIIFYCLWSSRYFKLRNMFSNSLEPSTKISNKSFNSSSGNKVSSPICILLISIWEKIIVFFWICLFLILNSFYIFAWSWIFNFHTKLWSIIDEIHEFIEIFKPHPSISIMKIFSKCMHKILWPKM